MRTLIRLLDLLGPFFALALLSACGAGAPTAPAGSAAKITLTLGAYTTPREAYAKLIPLFQQRWKAQTGQEIDFQESYLGSGAQSRAIIGGFEADIAALSLESDIDRIAQAGLIAQSWKEKGAQGIVSDSVVVIAVRKGNPKGIKDWSDLAAPGLNILTPDPKTSGGAQWNVMAMWGAAQRGFVKGYAQGDDASAREFLKAIFRNVSVLDKGARESLTTYEKGIGDVAITYENEVVVARKNGQDYEAVLPRSTILIENPVAVVDKYADKHGTRAAAEAFRDFLWSAEAQHIFAEYGLRSVDPAVAAETRAQFPTVQDLFKITEVGGWPTVTKRFFSDDGIYSKVIEEIQSGK